MAVVEKLFSPFGDVRLLPGRDMSAADVADADVLLVRSVTSVNESLLKGSRVKFIGSATIGTDHVDLAYLEQQGIAFSNAPGCNAVAVMNYVLAALSQVDAEWLNKSVGIIGCGNVGSRVYRAMRACGVESRCYDPFLTPDQHPDLTEFERVIKADILCLHTPLTKRGPYPTYHMFDRAVLASLKSGTLILNAGRGEVIDNDALKQELAKGRLRAVLDVWENEPDIDSELISLVELGTPHIAGYSLEGRIRGTVMVYEAFCRYLDKIPEHVDIAVLAGQLDQSHPVPVGKVVTLKAEDDIRQQILVAYNPIEDYQRLLAYAAETTPLAVHFDRLRKFYPLRREFSLADNRQ